MPQYRRPVVPGGTVFLTMVTHLRQEFLCTPEARGLLHTALEITRAERPFEIDAIVLIPDHLHLMLKLPEGDADFSTRAAAIKARFTREWVLTHLEVCQSRSRSVHRHQPVWQKRFWDHCIRDKADFNEHLNYVHYNPVKHGLVTCPHLWPWSTFGKWVNRGGYEADWVCACDGRQVEAPRFEGLEGCEME